MRTSAKSYIIRVDGGSPLGFGHLVRCLAIAEELLKNDWTPVFVTREYDHGQAASLLRDQNYLVHSIPEQSDLMTDAQLTLKVADQYQAQGVVVDLNHPFFLADAGRFADFLNFLKTSGRYIAVIDGGTSVDCLSAKVRFAVDAVFIPYFGAQHGKYQVNGSARLFLGPQYFIFREQFQQWILEPRTINKTARNILVTMGGSDAQGLTEQVISALREIPTPLNIQVALGMGCRPEIEEEILKILNNSTHSVVVVKNASNMAELLYHADIALVGSGLTKYEAAVLGTPMICLISQEFNNFFQENFEARPLGLFLKLRSGPNIEMIRETISKFMDDFSLRQHFSKNGKRLLDGNGTKRTVDLLKKGR